MQQHEKDRLRDQRYVKSGRFAPVFGPSFTAYKTNGRDIPPSRKDA